MHVRFRMLAAWLLAETMLAAAIEEAHGAGDVHAGCAADKLKPPQPWHSHGGDVLEPVANPPPPDFPPGRESNHMLFEDAPDAEEWITQTALDVNMHRNATLLDLGPAVCGPVVSQAGSRP
jgi:hypothetical protein